MASLFVDNLTVIDSSYLHPVHGIEGESWIVDLVLEGALDDQSMVMDFGKVKKQIKSVIDSVADHVLLVPMRSAYLAAYETQGENAALKWCDAQKNEWRYEAPISSLCAVDADEITTASLSALLHAHVARVVQHNVQHIHLSLRHEETSAAQYHYSHGLKKHDGNCQRLAHGHRSRIEIWRDGQRDETLEQMWAQRWAHIYLASREDVATQEGGALCFAYRSPQGAFRLVAPAHRCEVLPCDTTVECIADFIAQELKAMHPQSAIRVKAYEGVAKGAVAQR